MGDGCHKVVTQIETERLDLELVLRAGLPLVCHVMSLPCHHHHPSHAATDLISSNYIGLTDFRHSDIIKYHPHLKSLFKSNVERQRQRQRERETERERQTAGNDPSSNERWE